MAEGGGHVGAVAERRVFGGALVRVAGGALARRGYGGGTLAEEFLGVKEGESEQLEVRGAVEVDVV